MSGGPHDHGRGAFDPASVEFGEMRAELKNLNKLFEQHCEDDDRRHAENVAVLRANTEATTNLATMFKTLADSVAFMRPVVDSYVVTKGRLAMIATAGFGLLIVIGWLLEAGLKWVIGWLLKSKFGG